MNIGQDLFQAATNQEGIKNSLVFTAFLQLFPYAACVKPLSVRSAAWAVGGCLAVLLTGTLTYRYEHGATTSIPLYMLFTFLVAWQGGFRASIPAVIASTLAFDYFFTEPRLTLRVDSAQDIFAIASFAGASLLASHLSNRISSHAARLRDAEAEQKALYELSQSLLFLDWNAPKGDKICHLCKIKFHLTGVALWLRDDSQFYYAGECGDAYDSLLASFRARRDSDLHARNEHIRVLRFGNREIGSLSVRGEVEPLTVNAIGALLATHLERAKALRAEVKAASQAVSERLRTAVLDGLAHAVKTPLTTIMVSSSGLKEIGGLSPLQHELTTTIQDQANYLATLTDKLLRTAKLEDGEIVVRKHPASITSIVTSALDELRPEYDIERIHTSFPHTIDLLPIDADLMRMATVQLLENALKYSPGNSIVQINAEPQLLSLELSIHNEGTFIPLEERSLVFERYYRSPTVEHRAPGTGIGLSVTKQSVEAHGGRIWIDSDPSCGTTFHITIPLEAAP